MIIVHKKAFKKIFLWGIAAFICVLSTTFFINHSVNNTASGRLFYNAYSIPESDVAVVLGTSRYLENGEENWFFNYRMEAAAQLYRAGKVKKILVSGDNSAMSYNEPLEMLNSLIDRGVCAEDIKLDYAGFRTFDSMVRAKEVFGLNNFIVVSQEFHCERAIYIADSKGINVYGFVAKNPQNSTKTLIREYPARVNAFLDCHILNTKPHFLGEKVDILAGL
ncbi:MAG: YdcF family protein [Fimbriimonadaceae bacterium]|nr:YdcF family protein [Chitinophagales bacterium]